MTRQAVSASGAPLAVGSACHVCKGVLFLVFALLLSSCAQTKSHVATGSGAQVQKDSPVLLMPIDVELAELTAAGLLEPKADWTETGLTNVSQAMATLFAEKNLAVVHFDQTKGESDIGQLQILKLHEAVGAAILTHKYNPALELPTKENRFDWSLGPQTAALRETYGTDYALFIFMRDSFSSDGRVALSFVTAVLFGVALQGGQQVGFASLVDLNSGDVVWFNTLQSQYGDLRKPDSAQSASEDLLSELPL